VAKTITNGGFSFKRVVRHNNTINDKNNFLFLLFAGPVIFSWLQERYYPGAVVSPYVSIFDIKDLYRGEDITLTKANMYGSEKITAMVVSDHSGGICQRVYWWYRKAGVYPNYAV
jgi:hypothetical protein